MIAPGPATRPFIVGIGGFTSDTGKTTLLCDLLRAFPGWEAIKTTRGHYRSCGKDPHACCVSHLLGDEATVKSGREQTYTEGKDTGRYWDAGAGNVHWVVGKDSQIQDGVRRALDQVKTVGVFIEGNSFSRTIRPDFFVMVVRADKRSIKATARSVLPAVSAFYASGEGGSRMKNVDGFLAQLGDANLRLPLFDRESLPALVREIAERSGANQFA